MLRVIRVTGSSLQPILHAGDFVVISRIPCFLGWVRPGDLVVFWQAEYGRLVKMVTEVHDGGRAYSVTGVQAGSVDSRSFGPVPRNSLLGKVIWRVQPGRSRVTKL